MVLFEIPGVSETQKAFQVGMTVLSDWFIIVVSFEIPGDSEFDD